MEGAEQAEAEQQPRAVVAGSDLVRGGALWSLSCEELGFQAGAELHPRPPGPRPGVWLFFLVIT